MPRISSINTRNACKADDKHRNNPEGDAKRQKVFNHVMAALSYRVRNITYADIAKFTGLEIGQVKYHFKKLVYVGAIRLQEKEGGAK